MADASVPRRPQVPPPMDTFSGLVNSFKKPELQDLAAALGISKRDTENNTKKKDILLKEVQEKLETDKATLAVQPRFEGLYITTDGSGKKKKKGKTSANSASKTAEDLKEEAKPAADITGANLKLLQSNSTVDPPARFKRLGTQTTLIDQATQPQQSEDQPSSPLTIPSQSSDSDSDSGEEEDKQLDGRPQTPNNKAVGSDVVVYFINEHNRSLTHTVTVPNFHVVKTKTSEGMDTHIAPLHMLAPAALLRNSPVKDTQGSLARPAFVADGGTHHIGSIKQILDAHKAGTKLNSLDLDRANNITLGQDKELFTAKLIYTPADMAAPVAPGSSSVPPPAASSSAQMTTGPTSLTGDGSDRPLEIAQARAATTTTATTPAPNSEELFQLLRLVAEQEGPVAKIASKTAADAIVNYVNATDFLNKFEGTFEYTKGHRFPPDWDPTTQLQAQFPDWASYRNKSFTKDQLMLAAGLKKSSTKENDTLMKKARKLKGALGKWVRMAVITPRAAWTDSELSEAR
ncbi:hypothetical protein FB45DRAFT_1040826 [Roridomyces roridus]|uniref:Uncharacterized protein n=1 Tax=Roridomyces roridus TaxID=1738132 RepID=A0AAD7B130_9AGAR|nr:hypothetical protein FB45DRAFT_1040826 [Roridomyces roridus]